MGIISEKSFEKFEQSGPFWKKKKKKEREKKNIGNESEQEKKMKIKELIGR